MLSYAFTSLRPEKDDPIAGEKFENIHNLFAAILGAGIGKQLKRGLYREYVSCQDNLSTMRGKINMPGTVKNMISRKQLLSCEYDELSENNLLNQILKTTVHLLLKSLDVETSYKDDLKKEMLYFSGVDVISPQSIQWSSIRIERNNQSYRMLLGVCQMILEGMLLTTDEGDYKISSFVDDQYMSHLYEKFILEYYIKEHPELKASAARIPWALDNNEDALLPAMQSDIMLESKTEPKVLIIDAKYYGRTLAQNRFGARMLHSANLYQIFTYVKNKDADMGDGDHEVSGMLLYARTDEDLQPDNSYEMSGNTISVKTLNLNREFGEIAGTLDAIPFVIL